MRNGRITSQNLVAADNGAEEKADDVGPVAEATAGSVVLSAICRAC